MDHKPRRETTPNEDPNLAGTDPHGTDPHGTDPRGTDPRGASAPDLCAPRPPNPGRTEAAPILPAPAARPKVRSAPPGTRPWSYLLLTSYLRGWSQKEPM